MSQIKVDTITDELGTGAPNFPFGAEGIGGGGFTYAAVTGDTQDLDLDNGNFFDGGTLTADTTLTFSNVPDQANWRYRALIGASGRSGLEHAYFTGTSFNPSDQITYPWAINFNDDGTIMYALNASGDTDIYQYDLSVAYDVSTAVYSKTKDLDSTFNSSGAAYNLIFNDTGTKLWVAGFYEPNFYQYNLSTAWDIATASYANKSFTMSPQGGYPYASTLNNDGTILYILGYSPTTIFQYSLSTPYDLTSASYANKSFDYTTEGTSCKGLAISDDGAKMFMSCDSNDTIFEYALSTPYDVSTATVSHSFYVPDENLTDVRSLRSINSLNKLILTGEEGMTEISVIEPTSLTLPSSVSNAIKETPRADDVFVLEFFTTDTGATVELIGEAKI